MIVEGGGGEKDDRLQRRGRVAKRKWADTRPSWILGTWLSSRGVVEAHGGSATRRTPDSYLRNYSVYAKLSLRIHGLH